MSHFAQIDENNIVINVLACSNDEPDEGYQWLIDNLDGRWIQTSVNTHAGEHLTGKTPVRFNYAGIGYTYDETRDAFIPPKPEEHEWVLNETTCQWDIVEESDTVELSDTP
jgi:hypothetical protein